MTAKQLGNLQEAFNALSTQLRAPDVAKRTEEVQQLGLRVVRALEKVLDVLTDRDEVKSLERKEEALREAKKTAADLAREQEKLKKNTRKTRGDTQAEKSAKKAMQDIEKLQRDLEEIDRRARRDLKELDRMREQAQQLDELTRRQKRLHNETKVQGGETDSITPKINRALAELQRIQDAARKAGTRSRPRPIRRVWPVTSKSLRSAKSVSQTR